jgi:hypothetical protein
MDFEHIQSQFEAGSKHMKLLWLATGEESGSAKACNYTHALPGSIVMMLVVHVGELQAFMIEREIEKRMRAHPVLSFRR